ncbi:hypothetical protein [Streptomyces sp. H27-D2]|uniref:hypothetical protein n=1 Tax=Streptomyces sp. H27-D2 TaxID=3046304 RepID=UPI002DB63B31|nr:hypothetical protein [Streptomyces sp. H27-D2]MEC4019194.1 hypothetical protein [Streptomyces sp. H27-D2]
MPLPFLTADREVDDFAVDTALPFDDRDYWRRPYRPGPWRVGAAALLLLLASFVLFAAMIIAFAGGLPGAGVCVALAALIIAGALRGLRVGIWVSEQGLRQIGLFTTETIPWSEVSSVRTLQQPVRWLALPRTVQGQALVIERTGRAPLSSRLTDHNADFLGRSEAFDMATDAIEGWAAEHQAAQH